jgi:hypothetical protein
VFITEESITNTNNFTNNRKNSISFLGMPIGTRRSCLKKKTGDEKSRDTVPLHFSTFTLFVSVAQVFPCFTPKSITLLKISPQY